MSDRYYMEARGSMTRFDPLLPSHLEKLDTDLTCEELDQTLSECGLSMNHVLYDETRIYENTFYADYERGLYFPISLYVMTEDDKRKFQYLAIDTKGGNEFLQKKDWERYYRLSVPVPMLIYDFNRRYRDIPPEQVFAVWYSIHRRIDYANGMWLREVMEYVFDHAPDGERPAPGKDGLVTLYRGMGELSQPAEEAVSWSTSPENALWFANHSGHGTRLAVAEINPAEALAYFHGYRNENEVIVRPGTPRNIRYEDMLPSTQETFNALAMPALLEFSRWAPQAMRLGYEEVLESPFRYHGVQHILRVLFLSLIYYYKSGDPLTEADKNILIAFSLLHDLGRTNDGEEENHGKKSVELIRQKDIRIKSLRLSKRERQIVELLIRLHCVEDRAGLAEIDAQPGFSRKDKEYVSWLYLICKDMDGLDRVRFAGLDYRRLRTPFAKKLPLVAGGLLNDDILKFVKMTEGE